VGIQQVLHAGGEILAAAVGVKEEPRRGAALGQGHGQRFADQLLRQRAVHRPAHDPAGEEVEHDGQMEPALAGADRGDVRHPGAVGGGRPEDALEPIGRGGQLRAGGGRPAEVALGAGDDPFPAHEPGDAVATTRNALVPELLMDPGRAIRLAPALIGRANVHEHASLRSSRRGAGRRHQA
jgi:hypothetical protein